MGLSPRPAIFWEERCEAESYREGRNRIDGCCKQWNVVLRDNIHSNKVFARWYVRQPICYLIHHPATLYIVYVCMHLRAVEGNGGFPPRSGLLFDDQDTEA